MLGYAVEAATFELEVILLIEEVKPVLRTMDALTDDVVIAVDNFVKRLLAASGMTIGAPLRTRKQKAAKLLFYIFPRKEGQKFLLTDG